MSCSEAVGGRARDAQAIVCLDSSVELWTRLKLFVDAQDCPSEYILARSQRATDSLVALCRRLAPVILIIEEARLQEVPLKQLHELIVNRDVHIVVFSNETEDTAYEALFRQGCAGVLPFDVTDKTLKLAIQAIFNGELWLPRKVLARLARESSLKSAPPQLTRREVNILNLICQGLTNQEIADQLFISRETVRWHVRGLYAKMGVNDRAGAIRAASKHL
jgi:DNA-binding NarL/FixJ family response regulator